jgi:hypothetical protein
MHPARERAIRQHIRNFLVGKTVPEVQIVLDAAIAAGDTVRIKYTNEWLGELLEEEKVCDRPYL